MLNRLYVETGRQFNGSSCIGRYCNIPDKIHKFNFKCCRIVRILSSEFIEYRRQNLYDCISKTTKVLCETCYFFNWVLSKYTFEGNLVKVIFLDLNSSNPLSPPFFPPAKRSTVMMISSILAGSCSGSASNDF